jgi:hypothetical protein
MCATSNARDGCSGDHRELADHPAALETVHAILTELIREGIARGEFRDCDPVTSAHCVQAAMVRFCHPRLMVNVRMPHPTLDEMVDFLLMSLTRPS